ncbi:hypothetical protein JTB14_036691 [Gonioctena quinquepunctata]|nr:hypothetical protein JTB14_036691 [Gonioctena quinquepunctata]
MENLRKNGKSPERKETSEISKPSKSAESPKSHHISARVLQKKLYYETEKKRIKIEMEKAKLENQLRLLQLEYDIQEAQIWDAEEERQSQNLRLGDVQPSMSRVNNSDENIITWNRPTIQPIITKAQKQGGKILQVNHLIISSNQELMGFLCRQLLGRMYNHNSSLTSGVSRVPV